MYVALAHLIPNAFITVTNGSDRQTEVRMRGFKPSINFSVAIATLFSVAVSQRWANAVEFGWQELPGGGIEYRVQIEPDLLDIFRQEGYSSEIPPGLRDVRRIRITTGTARLPNQGDVQGPAIAQSPTPAPTNTVADAKKDSESMNGRKIDPSKDEQVVPTGASEPQKLVGASASPLSVTTFNGQPNAEQPNSAERKTAAAPEIENPLSSFSIFQFGKSKGINSSSSPTGNNGAADASAKSGLDPSAVNVTEADRRGIEATTAPAIESNEAIHKTAKIPQETSTTDNPNGSTGVAAAKPWLPFMIALLGLFASLAANMYLVWIHQHIRSKYLALLRRMPERAGSIA
jgi:hypothetical protein